MFYLQKNLQKKINYLWNDLQENFQKNHSSQKLIVCLKSAIELLEKGKKNVQS